MNNGRRRTWLDGNDRRRIEGRHPRKITLRAPFVDARKVTSKNCLISFFFTLRSKQI